MLQERPLVWAIALSLVLVAATTFAVDIDEVLFVLAVFVPVILGSFALIIAVLLVRRGFVPVRSTHHLLAGVLLLSVMLGCHFFGQFLGTNGRFLLLRPYYEHQVEKVRSGDLREDKLITVDEDLIAFPWYRGLTDNWVGLVYDPSDNLDRSYSKSTLGGDLVGVNRLGKHWFLCLFT